MILTKSFDRPDGSEFEVEFSASVYGRYRPGTWNDPPEYPEYEITSDIDFLDRKKTYKLNEAIKIISEETECNAASVAKEINKFVEAAFESSSQDRKDEEDNYRYESYRENYY